MGKRIKVTGLVNNTMIQSLYLFLISIVKSGKIARVNLVLSLCLLLISILFPMSVNGRQVLQGIDFSGQFFLSFEHNILEDQIQNEFAVKRGYITFRRNLSDAIQVRFTQDVAIDRAGDGAGNIELRIKYALVNYTMKDAGIFKRPNIELGVVNRPWINFEQDVNDFRSQESMFLDQINFFSSADYGITFESAIGEHLDKENHPGLNSNPGKYGSFAIGVYNGGGYSALERNNNKLVESRLSLRPLPYVIPGFQTTLFGAIGSGNIPESPDFRIAGIGLTYEATIFNTVLQGFQSKGDGAGRYTLAPNFTPASLQGWSAFFDIRPLKIPLSLTLRYDELYHSDLDHFINRQKIVGLAYIFENRSKILLNVGSRDFYDETGIADYKRVELVTEIRF